MSLFKFPNDPIPLDAHAHKFCTCAYSGKWHIFHFQQRVNAMRKFMDLENHCPAVILNYGSRICSNEKEPEYAKKTNNA